MPFVNSIKFSIIVPVFHEGDRIHDLMEHLHQLDTGKNCEIIIVDGAPGKDTLKTIHSNHVIKVSSEKGRAKQMNAGASMATGEILIFLHADTELPTLALQKISAVMEQGGYVAGAFDLGIKSDRLIFKIIASLASLRSRLNRIPYGDQAIFIRREYFDKIGGYKEIPLMEDVELMKRIKKSGYKIRILYDRVKTSSRRWEQEGVIYCVLRNWTLQILYALGISPHHLARFYKSEYRRARSDV
jgi:rSAM/selenodomain-associated transferase 2